MNGRVDSFDFVGGRPSWQHLGACRGMPAEWWFPERGQDAAEAKRVCLSCPVREECSMYATNASMRFGIWGGIAERKRRQIKRANDLVCVNDAAS